MLQKVEDTLIEHQQVVQLCIDELQNYIYTASLLSYEAMFRGNKLLVFGNGASGALAQHITSELVGHFGYDRKALPAMALSANSVSLTGISQDFDFNTVYARQVEAFAKEGDVVLGISAARTCENVYKALQLAKAKGCKIIGLSGKEGAILDSVCDVNILVESENISRIQEAHMVIGHIIVASIDTIMKDTV